MPKNDYFDIAKELGKKVDSIQAECDALRHLNEEAEYAIEKALYVIYQTPYLKSVVGATAIIHDIEDTLAKLKSNG